MNDRQFVQYLENIEQDEKKDIILDDKLTSNHWKWILKSIQDEDFGWLLCFLVKNDHWNKLWDCESFIKSQITNDPPLVKSLVTEIFKKQSIEQINHLLKLSKTKNI